VIFVESKVQIEMYNMSRTMSQISIGVFEESCAEFLEVQFAGADPPIFENKCEMTEQQFLSLRRLRDNTNRRLDGLQPLLVDVTATGKVFSTGEVFQPADIKYDELVYGMFAVQDAFFVDTLQRNGEEAGIGDFEQVEDVKSIRQLNEESAVSTPDDLEDEKSNGVAIAAIAAGGGFIALAIAGLVYQTNRDRKNKTQNRKNSRSRGRDYEDEYSDDQVDGFEPDPVYVKTMPGGPAASEDSVNRNDNLTYAYSLEDGIVSPNSLSQTVSPVNFGSSSGNFRSSPRNYVTSPASYRSSRGRRPTSKWDDGVPIRIRRDAIAPPGKLGIIIDTSSQGPIVHTVKPGSVLEGLLFEGDLIVAVDDEDTSEWSAHSLTRLMAKKSKFERKITVLSMDQ